MMANQSSNDNHGQRAGRSRRVFQFAVATMFSIWLLFQINHQFDSKRHRQNEENTSIPDSGALLLGRKVNLGFMAGGLVPHNEEDSYLGDNDIASESEKTEKLIGEAREGLIREESVGFPKLIVEVTGDGRVRDGGAVTYEGNVFADENGVPPDVSGVYTMKSEDDIASAALDTL